MENSAFTRVVLGVAVFGLSLAPVVRAETVWTDWTTATLGTPGSVKGLLDGVKVSYSGEVDSHTATSPGGTNDWTQPASSFIGGTSTIQPNSLYGIITLTGASGTNTLTFSSPILNPVFAIWSLGQTLQPATFAFNQTPTLEAGGPDQYGGSSITVATNVVSGQEGSGVVQFTGTFSSISWTDTPEDYYGFTVGEAVAPAPEPATLALFGSGIVGLALVRRFRAAR